MIDALPFTSPSIFTKRTVLIKTIFMTRTKEDIHDDDFFRIQGVPVLNEDFNQKERTKQRPIVQWGTNNGVHQAGTECYGCDIYI